MRYAIVALAFVALGCATRPVVPPTQYYLEPVVKIPQAAPLDKTLGIRPIEAALPYRLKVVHRNAGFVLGQYESIQWAEMPNSVVTRALSDALVATHRFKDVGDAAHMVAPDLALTGELRRFDVVRTGDPWTAECEVRLELRETQSTKEVWSATLSAKVPLERSDPSTLPAAMSRALAQIVEEATQEIVSR